MESIELYVDPANDYCSEIDSIVYERGIKVVYLYPCWHSLASYNYKKIKDIVGVEGDGPLLRDLNTGDIVAGFNYIKDYLKEYGKSN